jgi:hypothetical protein
LELSIEDKLILAAARLNLADDEIRLMDQWIMSVCNWEYFTDNVIRNGAGPLVYKNFTYAENYSLIPSETISKLKQAYFLACDRNEIFYKHFQKTANALSDKGISVIALKGIFLAEVIYKEIGLRPMSDIDILVKKEDTEESIKTLLDTGYAFHEIVKTKYISKFYHNKHLPPLVSGNISIELHIEAQAEVSGYNVNINDYWKNAISSGQSDTRSLALSPNDLLQYLCLHLDNHFYSGKIQLYLFCDIAEVLKYYRNDFNWEMFYKSCDEYNCTKNVYRHLILAHKYFDAPLPEDLLNQINFYSDQQTEKLFIYYLKGEKKKISDEILHSTVSNLKKVKGTRKKILYLIHDIFPSGAFIKKRYKVKNRFLIFVYYLVRFKTGVVVLFRHILK